MHSRCRNSRQIYNRRNAKRFRTIRIIRSAFRSWITCMTYLKQRYSGEDTIVCFMAAKHIWKRSGHIPTHVLSGWHSITAGPHTAVRIWSGSVLVPAGLTVSKEILIWISYTEIKQMNTIYIQFSWFFVIFPLSFRYGTKYIVRTPVFGD